MSETALLTAGEKAPRGSLKKTQLKIDGKTFSDQVSVRKVLT